MCARKCACACPNFVSPSATGNRYSDDVIGVLMTSSLDSPSCPLIVLRQHVSGGSPPSR